MCVLDQYRGNKTIAEVGTTKICATAIVDFQDWTSTIFSYFLYIFMKESNSKVYS
jgi:hypothetical protein